MQTANEEQKGKSTAVAMSLSFLFLTFLLCRGGGLKIFSPLVLFVWDVLEGGWPDRYPVGTMLLFEAAYVLHLLYVFYFRNAYTGFWLKALIVIDFIGSIVVMLCLFLTYCFMHSMDIKL